MSASAQLKRHSKTLVRQGAVIVLMVLLLPVAVLMSAIAINLAYIELAERMNVPSRLIARAADIDWAWLGSPRIIGLTAGASAPEVLVREVVDALSKRFDITEEEAAHVEEGMVFKLPRELVDR